MRSLTQLLVILRVELRLFLRYPKLVGAALLVICIPALYCLIYLSSVWDPAAHTNVLPVGLVNLDEGVEYRGQVFNIGQEVATTLRKRQTFGFRDIASEAEARARVRQGTLAFALLIPRDFSSNALPGNEAGAGKLVVYTSAGNNYESAQMARNFASELGHDVNESLNERRWQLVLLRAAGSQRNVDQLREGIAQLRSGAGELRQGMRPLVQGTQQAASGARTVNEAVEQLNGGVKQLGGGLRTLDARRPRGTELDRLKEGAEQLAAGHTELTKGMQQLKAGGESLRTSVGSFREQARGSAMVPAKVVESVDQLHTGMTELDGGLQTALDGQLALAEGADRLSEGVGSLTSGVHAMNQGLRSITSKLPEDSQLDELARGSSSLVAANKALVEGAQMAQQGAERLGAGIDLLTASLPSSLDQPDGSARGLATSVSPVIEVEAPVPNSGSGFAPNIIPAALWLGAGVAAFLVQLRLLPTHAQHFAAPVKLIGKMLLPALIVLLQVALVFVTIAYGLRIQIAMTGLFALTLALSALTFLSIVVALTRAMGDAGKALSLIFLAIQLSSSGGILPVELSGTLYSDISPWLPLTWVVRAMKISLFGAYEMAWLYPLGIIGTTCLAALVSACWIGRWRYVRATAMRPALDY